MWMFSLKINALNLKENKARVKKFVQTKYKEHLFLSLAEILTFKICLLLACFRCTDLTSLTAMTLYSLFSKIFERADGFLN